jgi:hypothetical protein
MSAGAVIVRAAIAPMLVDATVRAEQVTQLLLGETADLLESRGEWLRLRAHRDGYEGWVNEGYLLAVDPSRAARWAAAATAWSEGARVLTDDGVAVALPVGARVALSAGVVELPDGRRGRIADGYVRPLAEIVADARRAPPERWALERFEGAPYQWGGRTPSGVDCSGLVQTAFAARGVTLPRDSSKQALAGEPVGPGAVRPGDLLFFHGEASANVTHVAFAAEGGTLVHSTISCGGVLREPHGPGTRAEPLMRRLVAARRVLDP